VLMAVLASITLVPSVLSVAGNRIVPKSNKKKEKQNADTNFWGRFVTKNPIMQSVCSILILLIISIQSLHLEMGLHDA
ncbi:MMPL family transporter, partial [Bacillus vallismortis]|nr:MMPL family transporter [Bacillus vallismortis]